MKNLLIIRHAKSDQSFFGNDFERPLNERGKTDAPMMAGRLVKKNITVDAFVSSPAKRAKKTAAFFAGAYKIPEAEIILVSALYNAPADAFYEVVAALPDQFNTVALFSHNPDITYFVNSLHTKVRVDNMPTCGIFAVDANITEWKDFLKTNKTFLFFDYPKK